MNGQNLSGVRNIIAGARTKKTRQILAHKHLCRVQLQCHLLCAVAHSGKPNLQHSSMLKFYPSAIACGTIRILPSFFGLSRNGI